MVNQASYVEPDEMPQLKVAYHQALQFLPR